MSDIRALLGVAAEWCGEDERAWAHLLRGLEPGVVRALFEEFGWQAHAGQWAACFRAPSPPRTFHRCLRLDGAWKSAPPGSR